jgi:hypothetical protein
MNVLQLAQQIESDYGVKIARADLANDLSETNLPIIEAVGTMAGVSKNSLTAILEYGGGIRAFFSVAYTVYDTDVDSCLFDPEGYNKLTWMNKMAAETTAGSVTAALSNVPVKSVPIFTPPSGD